eukprot:GHVN01054506.1.p1 GENE.GHVN01054506.1~~GHVN01054506.1.p1  ORF type:complete len:139 (-),score=11.23 GHVN01054506.1:111-527(-)
MTEIDRAEIDLCKGVLMGIENGDDRGQLRVWLVTDESIYPPYADSVRAFLSCILVSPYQLGYFGVELEVPRFGLRFVGHFKEQIEGLGGAVVQPRELTFESPWLFPKHALPDVSIRAALTLTVAFAGKVHGFICTQGS